MILLVSTASFKCIFTSYWFPSWTSSECVSVQALLHMSDVAAKGDKKQQLVPGTSPSTDEQTHSHQGSPLFSLWLSLSFAYSVMEERDFQAQWESTRSRSNVKSWKRLCTGEQNTHLPCRWAEQLQALWIKCQKYSKWYCEKAEFWTTA